MIKCSDLNRGEIRHAVQNAFNQYGPKPTVDQITDWVFTSFAPKFPDNRDAEKEGL